MTAQSTVDAFWYLVRLNEPDRLEAWLADHPHDAAFLRQLLKRKETAMMEGTRNERRP